jgi:hypothetical protein
VDGADSALNGPTLVQAEAHPNFETWHALLKLLISLIIENMSELVNLCNDLEETEERQICHLLVLKGELKVCIVVSHMATLFIEKLILIFKLPD